MNPQDDFENAQKVFSFRTPHPHSALDIWDVIWGYLTAVTDGRQIKGVEVNHEEDGSFTVKMPLSLWQEIDRD